MESFSNYMTESVKKKRMSGKIFSDYKKYPSALTQKKFAEMMIQSFGEDSNKHSVDFIVRDKPSIDDATKNRLEKKLIKSGFSKVIGPSEITGDVGIQDNVYYKEVKTRVEIFGKKDGDNFVSSWPFGSKKGDVAYLELSRNSVIVMGAYKSLVDGSLMWTVKHDLPEFTTLTKEAKNFGPRKLRIKDVSTKIHKD